jgi:hypothetical protein
MNYGNAFVMVNMNVYLTHLVKDKLDRPYWELIDNKRQHTHLFRSFLLCADVFLQKYCFFTFVIRSYPSEISVGFLHLNMMASFRMSWLSIMHYTVSCRLGTVNMLCYWYMCVSCAHGTWPGTSQIPVHMHSEFVSILCFRALIFI